RVARRAKGRVRTQYVRHPGDDSRLVATVTQTIDPFEGNAQRLLDQNMSSALGQLKRHRYMIRGRSADNGHCRSPINRGFETCEDLRDFVPRPNSVCQVRIDFAQRNFDAACALKATHM